MNQFLTNPTDSHCFICKNSEYATNLKGCGTDDVNDKNSVMFTTWISFMLSVQNNPSGLARLLNANFDSVMIFGCMDDLFGGFCGSRTEN
jgi:hypothetical protein